jgi:ABC-type multidrug transport system fused ATPase/permease subunit
MLGRLSAAILGSLIFSESNIDSHTYEKLSFTDVVDDQGLRVIAEGTGIPTTKVTTSEETIKLKKFGRRLEATYEAIRLQKIEVVGKMLQRIGLRMAIDETDWAIETAIAGIRVSRSYTAAPHENEKFDAANERYKKARGRAYRAMGTFGAGMAFFNDFLFLVVLTAGGLFFYYGKIDTGDFAAFLLYITMFL